MRNIFHSINILSLAFMLCLTVTGQTKSSQLNDSYKNVPVVEFDKPGESSIDAAENERRKEKNKRYNGRHLVTKTPPPPPIVGSAVFQEDYLSVIPAAESSAIVIGTVLGGGGHLSEDKKFVYAEYLIKVSDALKIADGDTSAEAGKMLSVDVWGGFVRYSTGQEIFFQFPGKGFPAIGTRYLLFLTKTNQNRDYKILTGYELREGTIFPLDTTGNFSLTAGLDQEYFIKKVREAIAAGRQSLK